MNSLKPIGIRRLLMKKNVITIGIIVTGVLSIILTLLTYYGSFSGNFIVIVDTKERISSIVLSETEDFKNASPRLFADSVSDSQPLSYIDIKKEEAVGAEGNYSDPDFRYFAYSFYIMNNGNQTVDLEARYLITEVLRNVDKAIRIVIIKDGDVDNFSIYKKKDLIDHKYRPSYPKTTHFLDEKSGLVFSEIIEDFKPGEKRKYTVISFVEGEDPDSDDSISGGLIKMTFRFNIIDPE